MTRYLFLLLALSFSIASFSIAFADPSEAPVKDPVAAPVETEAPIETEIPVEASVESAEVETTTVPEESPVPENPAPENAVPEPSVQVAVPSPVVVVEPNQPTSDNVVVSKYTALAQQAQANFRPVTDAEVDAVRARLAQRVIAVERRVNPTTSFGAAWLDYLQWSGVQKQLASDAEVDLAAARKTLAMLGSGAEGLELPELQAAADVLEEYIGLAAFAGVKDQKKIFDKQAELLAKFLDKGSLDTARTSYEVERRLALFESAGRGGALVSMVHAENNQPNLLFEVQSSLLSRVANRPINDCTNIDDCILGTKIDGVGATSGYLSIRTLPAVGHARLVFALSGTTRTNTRGVNGPVAIRTAGNTSFSAQKTIELSDRSFRIYSASANARTSSRTLSVSKIGGGVGKRLVKRIAEKKIAEKRGQANAIASSRAEERVAEGLNEQLDEKIREGRRRYDDAMTKPLRRRRASPARMDYYTTSDSLNVAVVQAGRGQLAAPGSPPPSAPGDLSARVHQSAANNLLASFLGGATLERKSLDEPAKLVGRVTPPWLIPKKDEPTIAPREDIDFQPWSLRFRDGRPISVVFSGGQVTVTIHAARITVEEEKYDGWDLVMIFKPELADGRWKLVRQGDVEVIPTSFDPTSGKKIPSRKVALRSNLAKALNKPGDRLPQSIRLDPIDLKPGAAIDLLSMQGLQLENGWASTSWRAE